MHYRLESAATPETAALLDAALAALRTDYSLQAERVRLERACCGPSLVTLDGAPRPVTVAG